MGWKKVFHSLLQRTTSSHKYSQYSHNSRNITYFSSFSNSSHTSTICRILWLALSSLAPTLICTKSLRNSCPSDWISSGHVALHIRVCLSGCKIIFFTNVINTGSFCALSLYRHAPDSADEHQLISPRYKTRVLRKNRMIAISCIDLWKVSYHVILYTSWLAISKRISSVIDHTSYSDLLNDLSDLWFKTHI